MSSIEDIKQSRTEFKQEQEKSRKEFKDEQEKSRKEFREIQVSLENKLKEFHKEYKGIEAQSKEGSIWILRQDMFKSMDYHEATKTITAKQYKTLKDEFEYYKTLGGNHDVQYRWDMFNAKMMSGKITMVMEHQFTVENGD